MHVYLANKSYPHSDVFLCVSQGRHVKTGQLAAIKVMDVTGVSASQSTVCPHETLLERFSSLSHYMHFVNAECSY